MSPVGVVSEYGGSHAHRASRRGQRGAKQGSKVEMAPATLAREGGRGGACFCASSEERGCVSLFPNMAYHSVNYAVMEMNMHNFLSFNIVLSPKEGN